MKYTIVLLSNALKNVKDAIYVMELKKIDIDGLKDAEKHIERILQDIEKSATEVVDRHRRQE